MTLSVYFNVETMVRRYHAYQSVSVAVGENCLGELTLSRLYLFAVAVTTGELIVVGREKFPQFARCFYDKICQLSVGSATRRHCARLVVSKKFLEKEIFASWCL